MFFWRVFICNDAQTLDSGRLYFWPQVLLRSRTSRSPRLRPSASVKVNVSGSGDSPPEATPRPHRLHESDAEALIERAYNLKPFQIAGPDWLGKMSTFDIRRQFPPDTQDMRSHASMLPVRSARRPFQNTGGTRPASTREKWRLARLSSPKAGLQTPVRSDAGGPTGQARNTEWPMARCSR